MGAIFSGKRCIILSIWISLSLNSDGSYLTSWVASKTSAQIRYLRRYDSAVRKWNLEARKLILTKVGWIDERWRCWRLREKTGRTEKALWRTRKEKAVAGCERGPSKTIDYQPKVFKEHLSKCYTRKWLDVSCLTTDPWRDYQYDYSG